MGIYDREYYRDEKPAGIHLSAKWTMVTRLIVLNVAVFLLNVLLAGSDGPWLMELMAASPESLTNPLYLWQLLTYGFAHSGSGPSHIFWNMFGLFIFGRDVEALYGPKEFLRIYLIAIILGGIVWATRVLLSGPSQNSLLVGASGAVVAITLLFCIHYPKRTILLMFVLPVPAWFVGAMIIVGNLLFVFSPGDSHTAFDVHLVGAALAICYYKFGWNFSRILPSISLNTRWLKSRPKLKVHDPEARQGDLATKADALLEKVNRDGMDSLSRRERRLLEDYSRSMRQKHQ